MQTQKNITVPLSPAARRLYLEFHLIVEACTEEQLEQVRQMARQWGDLARASREATAPERVGAQQPSGLRILPFGPRAFARTMTGGAR